MTTIGPYTSGEIPAPLTVTFEDSTGAALDLTGYTCKWVYRPRGGAAVTRSATLLNQSTNRGQVQYVWVSADLAAAGDFEAEMWVGNGANRYASLRFAYNVAQAIATPAI